MTQPLLLVTASVDKISTKKPLSVEMDLMMRGVVAWVGRSSMEIRMEVIQPVAGMFHGARTSSNLFSSTDCVAWEGQIGFTGSAIWN